MTLTFIFVSQVKNSQMSRHYRSDYKKGITILVKLSTELLTI